MINIDSVLNDAEVWKNPQLFRSALVQNNFAIHFHLFELDSLINFIV